MESAALSSPNNVRLVIEELQRHRVLPSVLFRALAEYARLTARITEVRRYLDSLFHIGSESWIGTGSGPVKPKYAVHGDEIRKQMYSHFELLDEHSQRRDLRSYIRAVSGLIGYLRLEVSDSDYAFSRHASRLALDEHAVDACAALSMVLVGFGSYTTAQDTFTAFSGTFDTPAADLATCLLVHLKTNNVKEVDSFAARAYVDAVFTSASTTPVPESLLWRAFASESIVDDTGSRVSPPQVLFLLYLLYYYERTMGQPISGGVSYHTHFPKREPVDLPMSNGIMSRSSASGELLSTLSGRTNTVHSSASSQPGASGPGLISGTPGIVRRGEYSEQLLDSLPVAWILQRVSKCVEYSLLWPELLSMATTQFPDQLETVSVLQCELAANAAHATLQPSHAEFPALTLEPGTGTASWQTREAHLLSRITPRNSIFGESAQSILHAAENFEKLPIASRMKECSSFAEHMCCAALRHSQDAELTACVRQAWVALHSLNPHLVSTATINAWRGASETLKPALVPQDMWLDPLVILRSDARVFQSGSLVEIILTVLSQFLELSKTSMRRIYALRQRDSGALKKAHLSAIIQLQETSTIQALIEIARFVTGSDARSLIFGFIHARFLEQRTTQKLLHFQAYDAAAIGDMVDNVPSMHACSEFIPELLMQSAPRLQLFAIKLATAVLSTYPIAANEGMAREVILPHISTTLVQLVGTDNAEQLAICNAMFEAVVTIGSAFSLTRDECKRLADTVKEAAEDRTRGALSAATPLHAQGYAKWIRCCENVLAELRSPRASADGSGAFTSIENIDASEIVARLEKSPVADRKGHLGRGGSPGPQPPEMSSSQPAAAGGQQQAASMRPPGSLGPPLHQAHQQGQHAASSGIHKRPHSTIADERGSRSTVSASAMAGHETNGSAPDFGRGRGPTGGAVGSRAPSTASETSVDSSGAQGGPKRRNRHRHRFGGKDDAPRPPGLGPKRNKAPAGDRSRG
ncbi:Integrator complex subunit 2 [Coemansia sp. RSA 2320]|nr:Integrator complex subunit 2 [Coemansia sp. RSA 2320]